MRSAEPKETTMLHNLFSHRNQIIPKKYDIKFGMIRQEVTPDLEDVTYGLAVRKSLDAFADEAVTQCYMHEFFFTVHVTYGNDIRPINEDIHYNVEVKAILDWYMQHDDLDRLFDAENLGVVLIMVNRHFSYPSKHTFSIRIISVKQFGDDFRELKQRLVTPDPTAWWLVDERCLISIRGEYPINIGDIDKPVIM